MKDATFSNSSVSLISTADLPEEVYFRAVRFMAFMIKNHYHMGYKHFLVGTNTNYDEVCAGLIFSLKKCYPDVKLEMIFGSRYKKKYFVKISETADSEKTVSQNKFKYDMRSVNEYLTEHCDVAICYFPKETSNNTFDIVYSKMQEKPIYNIVKILYE